LLLECGSTEVNSLAKLVDVSDSLFGKEKFSIVLENYLVIAIIKPKEVSLASFI
jgi:hypothetical protein